jgi:hypothetical protein
MRVGELSADPDDARCWSPQPGVIFCSAQPKPVSDFARTNREQESSKTWQG